MRFISLLAVLMAGCAMVREQDLSAWVGVPAAALDTHSFFLTLPMIRTVTDAGIEVRNYPNKRNIGNCFGGITGGTTVSPAVYSAFSVCSGQVTGCDNIFYLKNGVVVEYVPVGACRTDERVQPEPRYKRLTAN